MNIELDNNTRSALATALENYLNGLGMQDFDEDEAVLEALLEQL